MAILYRHIRFDKNEPFYIGIGTDVKRAYNKKDRNRHWKNIVSKTDYEVQILFDDLTWEEACEKEKEFIALYGKRNNGGSLCNITDGGAGYPGLSCEYKEKHRESVVRTWTGRKHTDESRKKMSLASMGNTKTLGFKHTEETRAKMSKSNTGESNRKNCCKIVLDLDTGVFYDTIKELSILLCVPSSTLARQLRTKYKYKNKYQVI